ncbi:MAG: hypothetical protein ISS23_02370 [Nanoarchaeota archaeon]|nr:hypothetical protein [Nanoarchaeota archaeon]
MHKTLICYTLRKKSQSARTKLHRELYGYKDISNHGKYTYKRKGLIHKTKSKKIIDSVILTTPKNAPQIIKTLKKHKARTYTFNILPEDK